MGIGGAILGSSALGLIGSRQAARKQEQAADQSIALQREQMDRLNTLMMPYSNQTAAQTELYRMLGLPTGNPSVNLNHSFFNGRYDTHNLLPPMNTGLSNRFQSEAQMRAAAEEEAKKNAVRSLNRLRR